MSTKQQYFLLNLGRLLQLPPAVLTADTRFREDLGLADWELVWMVNRLERRYRVEISDAQIPLVTTPRALEPLLTGKYINHLFYVGASGKKKWLNKKRDYRNSVDPSSKKEID